MRKNMNNYTDNINTEDMSFTNPFVRVVIKTHDNKPLDIPIEDWNKMDKVSMRVTGKNGTNPEIITFHTRKCKPATQSLNMSKEAYEYMIDKDSCPSWSKPGKWAAMSEKERLEAHLQRTVEHLGGTSYTYQVFED